MRRPRALALWITLAGVAALVGSPACGEGPPASPCTDIPEGGCPRSRGVACADPACEAVYACREGNVWERVETCPPRPERRPDAGAPEEAPPDAGAIQDAAVDAPPGAFGGPGCVGLQQPDCARGLARSCGGDCCGCEDLYVCEDGGWVLWGVCGEGGVEPGR